MMLLLLLLCARRLSCPSSGCLDRILMFFYLVLYVKSVSCSPSKNSLPNFLLYQQIRRADPNILTALTWRKNFISNTDYDGPSRYKDWWKQVFAPWLDRIWELHLHSWVYDFLGVGVFLSHTAHLSRY